MWILNIQSNGIDSQTIRKSVHLCSWRTVILMITWIISSCKSVPVSIVDSLKSIDHPKISFTIYSEGRESKA